MTRLILEITDLDGRTLLIAVPREAIGRSQTWQRRTSEQRGDDSGHQTACNQNQDGADQESAEMEPVVFIARGPFC
jgi:hypothetical protein